MDLLIVLTYVALAWAVFKIFRIPVNQWTLATAALGGVFLVSGLILLMNYNHPYTFTAQKAVIAIPITPQVTGIVTEVTDKNNQLIQKGEVLFKLDPVRYQARVDRLQADLMTATHNIKTLRAQLTEAQANTTQVSAERDRLFKNYQRYLKGSQAAVNPFSERDIDDARQNFLAQDALQVNAFRRCPLRIDNPRSNEVADGSDQPNLPAALLSNRFEHIGGTGFPVGTCHAHNAHAPRRISIKRRRHFCHGNARVFHYNLRDWQRKLAFHNKGCCACFYGLCCIGMAVSKGTNNAKEQIPLANFARIVLQRSDREVITRSPFACRCIFQFR